MLLYLNLSPRKTARVLTAVVLFLTLASYVSGHLADTLPRRSGLGGHLKSLLWVNAERTLPTWYSSSALLACAFLLAVIAVQKKNSGAPYVLHWRLLAAGFLYLSADEATALHEKTLPMLRAIFGQDRVFITTWTAVAVLVVPLVALAYLRFLTHLPTRVRLWFLLASGIYLAGAIGGELVGEVILHRSYPRLIGAYRMVVHVEEFLEMMGVVVFLSTLLSYLSAHGDAGAGGESRMAAGSSGRHGLPALDL